MIKIGIALVFPFIYANLLINKLNYLAIDHELCLAIHRPFAEYVKNNDWRFINSEDPLRVHIFHKRLHRIRKTVDFSMFEEYLRVVNFRSILADSAEFLHSLDLPIGGVEDINSYLYEIKNDRALFIKLCKFLIT